MAISVRHIGIVHIARADRRRINYLNIFSMLMNQHQGRSLESCDDDFSTAQRRRSDI